MHGVGFAARLVHYRCFVLVDGVPVGRAVYSFGAANGVPEGSAVSEEVLTAVAEAWFAAVDG